MDSYKSFAEKKHELPAVDNFQEAQHPEIAPDQAKELSENTPGGLRELATLERHKAEGRMHAMLNRAEEEVVGHVVSERADSRPRGHSLFRKILVALDNSPSGRLIYEHALELATLHHSTLLLLHVLSYEDDGFENAPPSASGNFYTFIGEAGFEQYLEARERARSCAASRLDSLIDEARQAGVAAESVLETGSPERVIRRWAEEWGPDLIILGRRGHSGLSELFLGSVSNYVLHHVPCPVLVLQGERLDQNAAQAGASSESLPVEGAPVS